MVVIVVMIAMVLMMVMKESSSVSGVRGGVTMGMRHVDDATESMG